GSVVAARLQFSMSITLRNDEVDVDRRRIDCSDARQPTGDRRDRSPVSHCIAPSHVSRTLQRIRDPKRASAARTVAQNSPCARMFPNIPKSGDGSSPLFGGKASSSRGGARLTASRLLESRKAASPV